MSDLAYYTARDIVIPKGTIVGTLRVDLCRDTHVDFAAAAIGNYPDAIERGDIVQATEQAA